MKIHWFDWIFWTVAGILIAAIIRQCSVQQAKCHAKGGALVEGVTGFVCVSEAK